MIITCEKCATSYYVADKKIPAEGKVVRCSNCGHSWKQEFVEDSFLQALDFGGEDTDDADAISVIGEDGEDGDEEEDAANDQNDIDAILADEDDLQEEESGIEGDDDSDLANALSLMGGGDEDTDEDGDSASEEEDDDSIPEAIIPDFDSEDREDKNKAAQFLSTLKQHNWTEDELKKVVNFGMPAAAFFFVFLFLLLFKGLFVTSIPAMAGLYQSVGIPAYVPGEGLAFDKLDVQPLKNQDGTITFIIEGRIENTINRKVKVPPIELVFTQLDGTVVDTKLVDADDKVLKRKEETYFRYLYENAERKIDQVGTRFVLKEPDAGDALSSGTGASSAGHGGGH